MVVFCAGRLLSKTTASVYSQWWSVSYRVEDSNLPPFLCFVLARYDCKCVWPQWSLKYKWIKSEWAGLDCFLRTVKGVICGEIHTGWKDVGVSLWQKYDRERRTCEFKHCQMWSVAETQIIWTFLPLTVTGSRVKIRSCTVNVLQTNSVTGFTC